MSKDREAIQYIAIGKKGIGKTYLTKKILEQYVKGNPSLGIPPRKVLVLDVNNEFPYKLIACDKQNILAFMVQRQFEIRRVGVYKNETQDGKLVSVKKSLTDIKNDLALILDTFKSGLLLIEDISKYVGDTIDADLYGSLCTNRHVDCDVILHYQSIGKVGNPKIAATMNQLRFHYVNDSVLRHKGKFEERTTILRIAQLIVNDKYRSGDIRFYCYVDFDENKIKGNFDRANFAEAIAQYISEDESNTIRPILRQRDRSTGKLKYNYAEAFAICESQFISDYYGNKK